MALFWLVAWLMIAAGLLFVLPPLLRRGPASSAGGAGVPDAHVYRDQLAELERDLATGALSEEQYGQIRAELERRVLDELGEAPTPAEAAAGRHAATLPSGVAVGIGVPALALLVYFLVGTPEALDPTRRAAPQATHSVTAEQIAGMVERLAARMRDNPEDGKGWVMLARSYAVLGRNAEAVDAYRKAVERLPGDAQLLADYADILAVTRGRTLAGEPYDLAKRALAIDPGNLKALALAGTAAFEAGDYGGAVSFWERILQGVPADSEIALSVRPGVDEARRRLSSAGAPGASSGPAPDAGQAGQRRPAAAGGGRLTGRVVLGEGLGAKVAPGDTVFVFARAVEGARMPLAILKRRAGDLPFDFVLDDASAMSAAAKLSGAGQVVVGARISRSGDAAPASGDLEGYSEAVASDASGVVVSIDRVVP